MNSFVVPVTLLSPGWHPSIPWIPWILVSVRLAQKITEIGGSVEFKIWEGMPHDFQLFFDLKLFGRWIPECKKANQLIAQFIRKIMR